LSQQLFSLSIPDGKLTRFTRGDDVGFFGAHFVAAGASIVFIEETFTESRNIYMSTVSRFDPVRLTDSNPKLALPRVQVQAVSWPSIDKRWTIHGWLLAPEGDGRHSRLPLLVYAEGGPNMVETEFRAGGWTYPLHSFLANGVAVLIPNSRGRAGYGTAFEAAWGTERDCGKGPLADDLAGVQSLVDAGIVDPARVALAGYSWGGYLAAYALTHTNRFAAIIINEGGSLNMLNGGFSVAANADMMEFSHQLGEGNPFDKNDELRLRDLSPIFQVANATTPSLLEYGADSELRDAIPLFQGLKFFNKAPAELINYPHSGHVFGQPALRYDAAARDLEWFAYWVLGKPTQRMLKRYGQPPISEWMPVRDTAH
jgi:dipeptidyl aminopeptidase/acylaminoacyl peptidase